MNGHGRAVALALVTIAMAAAGAGAGGQDATQPKKGAPLRFVVGAPQSILPTPQSGRVLVVLGRPGDGEPREAIGRTGQHAPPVLGSDIENLGGQTLGVLSTKAAIFPIDDLAHLPPGDYAVQALFDRNLDLRLADAPGNLYSDVRRVHLDPVAGGTVSLDLEHEIPAETLPPDTDQVKFLKVPSGLLSKFHGRPIFLRAGVILPRDFARERSRHYPLRVHIGGFGERFSGVQRQMAEGSSFRAAWNADDAPRMILLKLDGAGPLGDPYQVNSANHGPYGDAVTQELIPLVEQKFRGNGRRVVDGGSTGGWVSLALQVFYPDFFRGCWSFCPDGVDFRSFQLVDIYHDNNAYLNEHGFERPSARDLDGDVRFTMRHECRMENVLGRGDSYTTSGQQWGAWNATYGPRGADGRPVPLWDPRTGALDRAAAEHWKKYDLRLVLETDWATLAPKLRGKIHIWVGEADDYFLNNGVHRLDAFLTHAVPPYEGSIAYGPGEGHCWEGITERDLLRAMAKACAADK
jgi:S-formylglutathione hydrolase FrmB